jgi:glycosyltransferase involved in cell wall biosynthesis
VTRLNDAQQPNVCIVVRYFTVGGLERMVISLANRLAARGVDTRVVVLGTAKRNALITELDSRIDVVPLSGPSLGKLAALRELTRDRIVHLHFGDGRIHPVARAVLWQRPVVVTYHSVYSHKRTWLKNRVDRVMSGHARRVIAVSRAVEQFCIRDVGLRACTVTVIPNGVDLPLTRSQGAPPDGRVIAVTVAGLYPHKNQRALLDGIAHARKTGLDARLRVIGDGPEMAQLYRQCLNLGIRSAVDWYGAVWRRDLVMPIIASSQVFVSASRFEGMPVSILEAMASGLPVVLSDIQAHRELAAEAGTYFNPDAPEQLAERLQELAADPKQYARLCAASLHRAGQYDPESSVDAHLAVYRQAATQ